MAFTKVAPAGIGSTPGDGYRIGDSFLHSTGVEITNINATGIVTAASLDISGAIDFDGQTNLDHVNIAGVTTITSSTYPLNVHADTAYQGILVNGNNAPTIGFNVGDNSTPSWKAGLSGSSHLNFSISEGTGNTNRFTLNSGGGAHLTGALVCLNVGIDGNIYHNSDTDTKLQFGTDTIDLHTGGSTRLRIDSSGRLLLGTTTYAHSQDNLTVYDASNSIISIKSGGGGGSNAYAQVGFKVASEGHSWIWKGGASQSATYGGAHAWNFYHNSNSPILFHTNNGSSAAERLRIDSDGRLSLGVGASPGSYPVGATARQVQAEIKGAIDTGNNKHDGSLAINCTNNNANLHLIRSDNNQSANVGLSNISFSGFDGADYHVGAQISAIRDAAGGNNDIPARLVFLTTADGASQPTEKVRIDKDGILWMNYGNPQSDSLIILDKQGGGEAALRFYNASANKAKIALDSSEELTFDVNGAERLRITSGGTVNIGGDYTNTTGKLKVTGVVTVDGGFNLTAGTLTAPGGFSISSGNVIISGDIAHDADSDTKFGFSSGADTFRIDTAGSRRIYVDSSGRTNISKNGWTGSDMTFGLTVHTGSTSDSGNPVNDGIMIVSQNSNGNQNSTTGKLMFCGHAQTNGPFMYGDNEQAYGKKALVFHTHSTANSYSTQLEETARFTFGGRFGLGTGTAVDSLMHIQGNSDNGGEACQLTIEDEDTSAGSRVPSIQFKGNGTNTWRIRGTDGSGFQFHSWNGSSQTERAIIGNPDEGGAFLLDADDRGWATFRHNHNQGLRTHIRQRYSPGNAVQTHTIMRIRRNNWGWGTFKITLRSLYYYGTNESVWHVNGHGVNGDYYNVTKNTYGGDASNHDWNAITMTETASSSSPGTSGVWMTDVKVNIPNYTYVIIIVEAYSSQYSTDPNSLGDNSYCMM